MFRVTRVTGNSSATLFTLRSLRGSFKLARGYSRCSGYTPTACVGTRAKRRGASILGALKRKIGRGIKYGLGLADEPAIVLSDAFAVESLDAAGKVLTLFRAFISPSETQNVLLCLVWPDCTTYDGCANDRTSPLRSGPLKCH